MNVLAVAAAGAVGALARYVIGGWIAERTTGPFPWGTLVVNASGSLVLGFVFVVLTERFLPHPNLRLALTVGFLGAYTTFSTFSLETLRLIQDGAVGLAAVNVIASVVSGLLAVYLGWVVGRAV